ncbi:MAG: folylpolyglutamate synthase/dihydrofolate synthase family protein [Nitrospiraceae bacterium]
MIYSSAVEYLYGLQKHGIKLGLAGTEAILSRLDHPERRYRAIHIGGTNGKGSTAAMVASVLMAADYRVGLYTSPHLVDFRERIRVNGALIPERRVGELVSHIRALVDPDSPLTFFEFTTALAFQYFAETQVDVAVLEVGMGGRFDATNVVQPVATAITTISLDHEDYLGHTTERIAYEKAGIIKPGIAVVLGRVDQQAGRMIRAVAEAQRAPVYQLGVDFDVRGDSTSFEYAGIGVTHGGLPCRLLGRHQLDNAACALALMEVAERAGLRVLPEARESGLAATQWEGRLETVDRNPAVVLDGAHNPAAAGVLSAFLAEFRASHPGSRVALILGMMRDKAHRAFVQSLLSTIDELIVTQAAISRAASPLELRESLADLMPSMHTAATPGEALSLARGLMKPADLICVAGSLMLVGDMKALLRGWTLSPVRG